MAAVKDEEYNLAFLENDDLDDTDAVSTRVIQLEKDSEIPTRYLIRKIFSPQLESPYHYHPAAEASQRPQKVHSKWGSDIGKGWYSFSRPDDVVALLTFEDLSKRGNAKLDEAVIWKITESLKKISGDPKLEPLRSSGLQLLMKFSLAAGYETLGKCFLDGGVEEVSHLKLVEIQAVSLGTLPPCCIEVACPAGQGDSLRESLTSLFVSKSSVFPFLSIREPEHKFADRVSPSNSPATKTRRVVDDEVMLPAVGIMLMFTQRAQRNSESCVNAMKGNPKEWEQVKLPQEISERDELYFKATTLDGPLIAVKKLSPCSGIRIILFVNRDMAEVERFYSLITGKSPLAYNKIEEGLSCRNFPLSEKLEFQLISHPSLRSHPVRNVALCFMMNDVNKMCSEIPGGVRNIGEGHWQVKDPEGNAVILYSLLK